MSNQIQTSSASPAYLTTNNDDLHKRNFAKRRCCFWVPFLNTEPSLSGSGSWQRIASIETNPTASSAVDDAAAAAAIVKEEHWWEKGWKKMREWSEIVAGPKWKTLIRKIGRKRPNYGRQGQGQGQGYGKFHYDPLSYAMNFDEGPGQDGHFDEDLLGRGFSSRYSLPPSCKSSLDFDKEGVTLT